MRAITTYNVCMYMYMYIYIYSKSITENGLYCKNTISFWYTLKLTFRGFKTTVPY